MLNGYKTILGAVLLLLGGGATMYGMPDLAQYAYATGGPLLVLGIGHKLDKILKALHLVAGALDAAATQAEQAVAKAPAATAADPPKA